MCINVSDQTENCYRRLDRSSRLTVAEPLQLALNRPLFKIFGALSKDTYQGICKYFGKWTVEEQISARKSKFNLRYCASESAVMSDNLQNEVVAKI